jgi:hypothetical protein
MYPFHLLIACIVFPTIANIISKFSKLYSIGNIVPLEKLSYALLQMATYCHFHSIYIWNAICCNQDNMPFPWTLQTSCTCFSNAFFLVWKVGKWNNTSFLHAWSIRTQKCYYKYFFSYILYTIEIVNVQCLK